MQARSELLRSFHLKRGQPQHARGSELAALCKIRIGEEKAKCRGIIRVVLKQANLRVGWPGEEVGGKRVSGTLQPAPMCGWRIAVRKG